jgi:hypothetical protein
VLNTISAVVIGSTIIICCAWIVTVIVNSIRHRANTRARMEIYNKLIDKFSSAPELIEFLQSDAGLRFIEEQAVEPSQPLTKIMSSIRLGVSLALVGIGTLAVSNTWSWEFGNELYTAVALGGTIALTAGLGFIIAAAISFKLCKLWGLIPAAGMQKGE